MKRFDYIPVRLLGELPWRRDQSKWSLCLSLYQLQNVFSSKVHFPGMKIETLDLETNSGFCISEKNQTYTAYSNQSLSDKLAYSFCLKFVNFGMSCLHNSLLPRKLAGKEEGRLKFKKLKTVVFTKTEIENWCTVSG